MKNVVEAGLTGEFFEILTRDFGYGRNIHGISVRSRYLSFGSACERNELLLYRRYRCGYEQRNE